MMDLTQLNRLYDQPDAPCVLIKGPEWGDASFLAAWLKAAAEAEALWRHALTESDFEKKIVRIMYMPDFGIAACSFVMLLQERRTTFVLPFKNEEGDEFAMMAKMGFFALSGDYYQMITPSGLTAASVKEATLTYAATEDEEGCLHPEHLVTTISYAEASLRQRRWHALQDFKGLHVGEMRLHRVQNKKLFN